MKYIYSVLLLACSLAGAQPKLPGIEEKAAGFKKYEGYLTFYWDENAGKIWLEIDKLDAKFFTRHPCRQGLVPMILASTGAYWAAPPS